MKRARWIGFGIGCLWMLGLAPLVAADPETSQRAYPRGPYIVVLDDAGRTWKLDDRMLIRQIENSLDRVGFYPGRIDGVADPTLHSALERFQGRSDEVRPGQLDRRVAARLAIDWSEVLAAKRPLPPLLEEARPAATPLPGLPPQTPPRRPGAPPPVAPNVPGPPPWLP